jgi:hypothetical protein
VCGSTGEFCLLNLRDAVFVKDAFKSSGKHQQSNQTFHLRIEESMTPASGDNAGGDDLSNLSSVSLLSQHSTQATADGDGDLVLLTSSSSGGGGAFRLVRIPLPHSVEQRSVRLVNQYRSLSAENESFTGPGSTVTLNHDTASRTIATRRSPHADDKRIVETGGGDQSQSELAVGCTRMFPLRLDDGQGPDTHMILSYGKGIPEVMNISVSFSFLLARALALFTVTSSR